MEITRTTIRRANKIQEEMHEVFQRMINTAIEQKKKRPTYEDAKTTFFLMKIAELEQKIESFTKINNN